MSYSSSARQKIATRIEKLTKQKALSEDQLLHLQFIFSRDDSVKILADRTRRLFRLDKLRYNDNTLDQVVKFLDVVENQAAQKPVTLAATVKTEVPAPVNKRVIKKLAETKNTLIIEQVQAQPQVKKMLAPARAVAPPNEFLPQVLPPTDAQSKYSAADIENDAISSAWLVEQTKRSKQAKKVDPTLCCPVMLTTLTMDARQSLVKKKRKKTAAKKRKSKIVEELDDMEELVDEDEEELEDVEEDEVKESSVVLYDDDVPIGSQQELNENEEVDFDEDEEEINVNDNDDGEGDEEVGDEEDDIEEDEEVEPQEMEASVHSTEESDGDDSD